MSGIGLMFIGREAGAFALTVSSNQTDVNLATLATSSGWNGSSALNVTINSGVYISSTSTATPALTVNGSFPGGVTLVNNGTIVGRGGAGGASQGCGPPLTTGNNNPGQPGGTGGLALSVSSAISITNNGTIAGGGGGGGGGASCGAYYVQGGGGGGGQSSFSTNSTAGPIGPWTGGPYGGLVGNAGNAGTYSAAGTGGAGRNITCCGTYFYSGSGGTGGSWGASGSAGGDAFYYVNVPPVYGAGGSAGGAVTGNSNITWVATGTRYGSIT